MNVLYTLGYFIGVLILCELVMYALGAVLFEMVLKLSAYKQSFYFMLSMAVGLTSAIVWTFVKYKGSSGWYSAFSAVLIIGGTLILYRKEMLTE